MLRFLKIFKVKLTFFQEFYLIAFVGAQGESIIFIFSVNTLYNIL